MSTSTAHIRHGFGTVRPYLYGHPDLLTFVKDVFGAEELERNGTHEEAHVEVKMGDSVVVLELGDPPATATCSSVYVYVDDVDAAYQRAIHRGATSLRAPADRPYGERNAGVRDSSGNTWWIATLIEPR